MLAGSLLLCTSAQALRISSYPFISGDTFRAIANHIIDETNQPFKPELVKPYDIIFLKTDYAPNFFATMHPKIPVKYILITHNSDAAPIFQTAVDHPWIGHNMSRFLDDAKLVVWFAQNVDYAHPKLIPIPIGIGNSYTQHGKIDIFLKATKRVLAFDKRLPQVYTNFTIGSNPLERKSAMDFLSQQSYAHVATPKSPPEYLEEMKHYRYVLSPPGNGLDCHRTWEALLVGCIPIVQHSCMDSMFEDLPVIFVNHWEEITERFLQQKFSEISKKTHTLEKIYADYWIALVKSFSNG